MRKCKILCFEKYNPHYLKNVNERPLYDYPAIEAALNKYLEVGYRVVNMDNVGSLLYFYLEREE